MYPAAWILALLIGGCLLSDVAAAGGIPGINRTVRTLQQDRRVIVDRLDSVNNPGHRHSSFLNAVGAVWPYVLTKTGSGYPGSTGERAATGFLIDRCHVLTSLHVAYVGADGANPQLARPVAFAVGQTASERDRGALQGLKYLLSGTVIAHGEAIVLDDTVHNPEDDWALIQLATRADAAISPMTIAAVDPAELPMQASLASAGYPSDHRGSRGDGFKLKDLWMSDGEVVAVVPVSAIGTLLESTLQITSGTSGSPIFVPAGQQHLVIGMVQSLRGNGIDVSTSIPNVQILFTPSTISRIGAAQAQNPCS